jgi:hypothetical protein
MANPFARQFWTNRAFQSDKKDEAARDLFTTAALILFAIGAGFIAVILWAWAAESLRILSLAMLLFGGTILVGAVLGLLFGIPKSVSDPTSAPPARPQGRASARSPARVPATKEGEEHPPAEAAPRSSYMVNTNLEQISDWLTKIIVGVSLTQIPTIREQFVNVAKYFGEGLAVGNVGDGKAGTVAAALIIIYGLTTGFLAGYLFTRIFLPGAFRRADKEAELLKQISEQQEVVSSLGRVQGEIYQELYRYDEQGFRTAISKLDELLRSEANQRNPALWVYLAAAHGQAYLWAQKHKPRKKEEMAQWEAELEEHKDAALTAVRGALALGDAWKPILQVMWNPHHLVKKAGQARDENDLVPFYSDRRFKRLLDD